MNMSRTDAAQLLGVSVTASEADMKKAYRKASMKHHPDRGGNEEDFKKYKRAYEVLTSKAGSNPAGRHSDVDTSAWQEYYAEANRQRQQMMNNGRDIQSNIFIDMATAVNGGSIEHSLNLAEFCSKCRGTGFFLDGVNAPAGTRPSHCDKCKGTGKSTERKTFSISIPKNTAIGSTLRLKGMGEQKRSPEGVDGDLYIFINFEPDEYYKMTNRQIYVEAIVSPSVWLLGGNVSIATPYGIVVIKVSPCVSESKTFRLPGKGVGNTDLYAVIKADWSSIDIEGNKDLILGIQKNIDADKTRLSLSGKFKQSTIKTADRFKEE